jgi:hypothetical protein
VSLKVGARVELTRGTVSSWIEDPVRKDTGRFDEPALPDRLQARPCRKEGDEQEDGRSASFAALIGYHKAFAYVSKEEVDSAGPNSEPRNERKPGRTDEHRSRDERETDDGLFGESSDENEEREVMRHARVVY